MMSQEERLNALIKTVDPSGLESSSDSQNFTSIELETVGICFSIERDKFLAGIEIIQSKFLPVWEKLLSVHGNESRAKKALESLRDKSHFYDCINIPRTDLDLAIWFKEQNRKIRRFLLSKIHMVSKTNLKKIIKLSSEAILDFFKKLTSKTLSLLTEKLGEKATNHQKIEYLLNKYQGKHIYLEDPLEEKDWELAQSKLEKSYKRIAGNFDWEKVREEVDEISGGKPNGEHLLEKLMEIDDPALPEKYLKSLFRKVAKDQSKDKSNQKEKVEIDRLNEEVAERDDLIKQLKIDYETLNNETKAQAIEYERKIAQIEEHHDREVALLMAQCKEQLEQSKKQLEEIERLKQNNEKLQSRLESLERKINQKFEVTQSPLRDESTANSNKDLGIDSKVKVIDQKSKQCGEIGNIIDGDRTQGWLVAFPMPEEYAGPAIQIWFKENQLEEAKEQKQLVLVSPSKGFGDLAKTHNNNGSVRLAQA